MKRGSAKGLEAMMRKAWQEVHTGECTVTPTPEAAVKAGRKAKVARHESTVTPKKMKAPRRSKRGGGSRMTYS